jgi:HEAT repeat protein
VRWVVGCAAGRTAGRAGDPDVHRAALVGLGISHRPEAEPVLIEAIASRDAATRLVAVAAIADFEGSGAVLAALARASEDPDESVRNAAIGFLASRAGADATAVLIGRLRSAEDPERFITALALPVEGRAEAVVAALRVADDELAPRLVAVLARMRRPATDQLLREVLTCDHVPARKAAATAVASQPGPAAAAALRRLVTDDPDPEVRRIAALLLAQ